MSAIISTCGTYRYRLDRDIGTAGPTLAFVMVNPSTADATLDDATIRKCIGFAKRYSYGALIVGNLFAYRATDVRALRSAKDPIGPENDNHLRQIIASADATVFAWGSLNKLPKTLRGRWKDVVRIADASGRAPSSCIGVCADGHPKHPLMVGYDTRLTEWQAP